MADAITTHPFPGRPSAPQPHRAPRTGLRREIGFIGLLWASGGSIIGSGWLFGAQGALASAGPAAVISWCIGAVAILMLALVHAELGAMYPVAGMGLIVYLSDFGPLADPWFPLWRDMLVVAVFSLGIFSWALRVALPRERIEALIERGAEIREEPAPA